MPNPSPMTAIKGAVKNGVSVTRFRISKADGEALKELEKKEGKSAATATLLRLLWPKS